MVRFLATQVGFLFIIPLYRGIGKNPHQYYGNNWGHKIKMKANCFYEAKKNGMSKINHYNLINFLEANGFGKKNFNGVSILVRVIDNIVYPVNESDLATFVKNYLIEQNEPDVLECFVKGIAGYLNSRKYQLLKDIDDFSDRDQKDVAWIYYKNVAVKITDKEIQTVPYSKLKQKIWNSRILDRDFNQSDFTEGQFYDFAFKLAKQDTERFIALQTALGYLMHRYKNPSLCKVIILLDENITSDGTTNGGTGKTLLCKALSYCKETVTIDGKNIKATSRFKNQRIKITTDIVNFDDVNKSFSLEEIYSMSTAGVIVEQKGKDEILLNPEDSPKIMITSNFRIIGPDGSSDRRRRYEFEVANYFDDLITPAKTYGNLFFEEWTDEEWNKFDCFMIACTQKFLQLGLIEPSSLNLTGKLEQKTCKEFVKFVTDHPIEENKWFDKKHFLNAFMSDFPKLTTVTSHKLTKWAKEYASTTNLVYEESKTAEKYEFLLRAA